MKQLLLFFLCPFLVYGQVQIGQDITGDAFADYCGNAVSLSSDGSILAIGLPYNDDNADFAGKVRIYQNVNDNWVQIGQDIVGDLNYVSGFSISMSNDGNLIAIGSPFYSSDTQTFIGKVKVFENQTGTWVQRGQDLIGLTTIYQFGNFLTLSADGNTLAVREGIETNYSTEGRVKVFKYNNGSWNQVGQTFTGDNLTPDYGRSFSLSANGNIIAISTQSGERVDVFENQNSTWVQVGQAITGQGARVTSISSDGTVLAVGSLNTMDNGNSNPGMVRIYKNQNGSWVQVGQDINGQNPFDELGSAVSLSADGNVIAISVPLDGFEQALASVIIYQNINNNWIQIGQNINGEFINDYTGRSQQSVDISSDGTTIAIGAPNIDSGKVRVFDISAELSLDSFEQDLFDIFVNDNQDLIKITLNDNQLLNQVNLYSVDGKYLYSEKSLEIKTNSLQAGIYVVEVETDKGKSAKKVIIK